MKLSEQLKVIAPTDRIRIIRGNQRNKEPQFERDTKILYCGYFGTMQYLDDGIDLLKVDPEVVRLIASLEVRHREFKERDLLPPYEPDITRMYEFNDMTIFLYYDIYIQ